MSERTHGLFITGTGTDVGKTYASALILKSLREAGFDAGYYKAAVSGVVYDAEGRIHSDATFVASQAHLPESHDDLVSFTYQTAVSPHLAARLEGNPVSLDVIRHDYQCACARHDYLLVEGSGGIVCPLHWEEDNHLMLEDVIVALNLGVLIVADAGLGTLNALMTTATYLRERNIETRGIILNNFVTGDVMHEDNCSMSTELTGLPVIARIAPGATRLDIEASHLAHLFA